MKANKGDWVQIKSLVLPSGQRAPGVPQDTAGIPLEMRVKGYLQETTEVGQDATVTTVTGRRVQGILENIKPRYTHGFGDVVPELLPIGGELRALMEAGK